jgi:hypothetical protein
MSKSKARDRRAANFAYIIPSDDISIKLQTVKSEMYNVSSPWEWYDNRDKTANTLY